MADDVKRQIAALEQMTVGQLQTRYGEVFGETARSGNRQWLFRRIAWRIQALAEGDLSERARQRARELARDADIRVRPPKDQEVCPPAKARAVTGRLVVARDERIPPAGSRLTKAYKGRELTVTVRVDGFEYDGQVYRSLSAIAHAITGSHWNGLLFFGLAGVKANDQRETIA
ncbi:MAG: DUF2924 domain-containing protein [Phycisphaeraceae bacterium]|nr:MAG: DUF2924 domain-containing protein [Phycisphaeraceae bacterium]